MIKAKPLSLSEARDYINTNHRHHQAAKVDKYRVGAEVDGRLVGVVQVGRPVSRVLDDGETLEVLRLCSDGTRDVCSFLYSRAARIAKELGYKRIITYILETENGASLRASGWRLEAADVGGKTWDTPSRPRSLYEEQISLFENRPKYPTCKKQRWSKQL